MSTFLQSRTITGLGVCILRTLYFLRQPYSRHLFKTKGTIELSAGKCPKEAEFEDIRLCLGAPLLIEANKIGNS